MHKIILTGYMGSGKTTVGLALAEQLSIPFLDLDEQIENETRLSISEVFEKKGIIWFYLKASVPTLVERLSKETKHRPLLNDLNTNLTSFIGQHLFERIPFYSYAKHTIAVDKKTTKMIVEEIKSFL